MHPSAKRLLSLFSACSAIFLFSIIAPPLSLHAAVQAGIVILADDVLIEARGPVEPEDLIFSGDTFQVGPEGLLTVLFADESALTLSPKSIAKIEAFDLQGQGGKGVARIKVTKGSYRFTPGEILANGGTQLIVSTVPTAGTPIPPDQESNEDDSRESTEKYMTVDQGAREPEFAMASRSNDDRMDGGTVLVRFSIVSEEIQGCIADPSSCPPRFGDLDTDPDSITPFSSDGEPIPDINGPLTLNSQDGNENPSEGDALPIFNVGSGKDSDNASSKGQGGQGLPVMPIGSSEESGETSSGNGGLPMESVADSQEDNENSSEEGGMPMMGVASSGDENNSPPGNNGPGQMLMAGQGTSTALSGAHINSLRAAGNHDVKIILALRSKGYDMGQITSAFKNAQSNWTGQRSLRRAMRQPTAAPRLVTTAKPKNQNKPIVGKTLPTTPMALRSRQKASISPQIPSTAMRQASRQPSTKYPSAAAISSKISSQAVENVAKDAAKNAAKDAAKNATHLATKQAMQEATRSATKSATRSATRAATSQATRQLTRSLASSMSTLGKPSPRMPAIKTPKPRFTKKP